MKKSILTFTILFFGLINSANTQITAITISSALDQMENSAEEILNDVDYVLNHTINNAAINILNSIHQFRDAYSDILNKTVDELTQQQTMAFNGLARNVNEVFRNINNSIDKVDNSIDNLALHMGHILIGDKIPRITKFSSPIIVRKGQSDILIEFKGVFLNNDKNQLAVNGKHIEPSEKTDKSLKFFIESQDLVDINNSTPKVIFSNLELKCYHKKWYWLSSAEKSYKYLIKTIPKKLATIKYFYDVEENVIKRKNRTEKFQVDVKSGSFRGFPPMPNFPKDKSQSFKVTARNGWQIDINTIKANCSGNSSCNSNCSNQIENKTSSGFTVNMYARTDSKPKVWCHYKCSVTFDETKTTKEMVKKDGVKEIYSETAESFDLPENTKNFRKIEAELFTGKKLIFDKAGTQDVIKIGYNEVTKLLSVKPLM